MLFLAISNCGSVASTEKHIESTNNLFKSMVIRINALGGGPFLFHGTRKETGASIPYYPVDSLFEGAALLDRQRIPRRLDICTSEFGCMEMDGGLAWEILRLEGIKVLAEPMDFPLKHSKAG